jgi:N-acetylneuraminate synthase
LKKIFIIAEAGVNHNGDISMARRLVDCAAEAGADAVKFQTFRANSLATTGAKKAEYQKQTTGREESQLAMLQRLELSQQDHLALIAHCRDENIQFLSAPFDIESQIFLTDQLGLSLIKLPSGEITNAPLLLSTAQSGVDIILSTGMCTLEDVRQALGVLAYGYQGGESPGVEAFETAFETGIELLRGKVTLLHCTTEYPAPFEDTNLLAIHTLAKTFGFRVGFSDHTLGISAPIAATALGATVIEKHLTLDRSLPGPDQAASLTPDEFSEMVNGIRNIEQALGDGVKAPRPSELKNRPIARKSLVALRPIKAGEKFTEANLGTKRPGDGLAPIFFWALLGTKSAHNLTTDELIRR